MCSKGVLNTTSEFHQWLCEKTPKFHHDIDVEVASSQELSKLEELYRQLLEEQDAEHRKQDGKGCVLLQAAFHTCFVGCFWLMYLNLGPLKKSLENERSSDIMI